MRTILPLASLLLAIGSASAGAQSSGGSPEDIYVVRSWRESRAKPTEYCSEAHTRFANAQNEDHYQFRAVDTRGEDGRVVDVESHTVGTLHACFGRTADSSVVSFYAEGEVNHVTFTGHGRCNFERGSAPEPGIQPIHCVLALSNLSGGYTGGQLTTNSVNSRQLIGGRSDPPGYTQPSIATLRLWRRADTR